MGLQKRPGARDSEAGQVGTTDAEMQVDSVPEPSVAPTPKAPAPTVVKAAGSQGKTHILLSKGRPLSDPYSGVTYTQNVPKPGVVKEGNWLDCQIKAGLLVEYVAPAAPEGEE